ncbi:unnamed protein product [Cuscuta epithymum]|uniref:RING-type domain-containing protein n=1 Tax=Cuscuta epithymum TaxID=186058 RepID=A0AAV0D463_9ASTE|nr:unnamed protein product [Cuscuta epithymum]
MWNFASNCTAGNTRSREDLRKPNEDADCSEDDEGSSITSRDEGLECPICCESFNIVENIPYVLWCGHTLCKNCILGLQWAVVKCPSLPIQLPLFIACPWCNLLSLRLVYRGNLKFPRKNFFLLWMLESMNGDRRVSRSTSCDDNQPAWPSSRRISSGNSAMEPISRNAPHTHISESTGSSHDQSHFDGFLALERLQSSIRKSLIFFVHLTAKFPLVIIFLLILLYAIPASAAILALYMLITVLFALPSVLILYFAYPSLDWLVREIIT